ncbi:hypothetical protein EYR38_008655 [Pleurotus pulmonarius]|nr:hypothetical protein EYR38_008655 [Pleurotus pulmonarius]
MNSAQCVAFSEILVLGGVKRSITKVAEQGNSAVTYKVDGGWPDPTTNKDVTAYAKTGKTPGETFKSEIRWLQKTDQLLAEGKYNSHQWIVFHGVNDKTHLVATDFGRMLIEKYMQKGDVAGCSHEVEHKIDLIIKEVEIYAKKFGVLHGDVQPGNVLWDRAAKDPTLIDWGRAEEVTGWTTAIANKVRQQAIYSHLKGEERICHDLKHSFSDSLTLNGVTRPLIKVADQGNTAITYKVGAGGWPDPLVKKDVTAYAKSGKRPGQTHDEEIKWLTKIHELLAAGKFNNLNWIVFRGIDNKYHIVATTYYHTVLQQQYLSKGNVQGCKDDFKLRKIPLIVKEAKFYVYAF